MVVFKILLFPFSVLYDLVTTIRNKMYDWGIFRSTRFPVKVISVGNLTVGGTGKSPVVEYLIRLLAEERKICTLSRGYGRKTQGFLFADSDSTAETIGDEPFQFYLKYSSLVKVAVGEKRAAAISKIISTYKETNLIIMDDAFQHRAVTPDFSILVTDFNRLFYKDFLLPAGRLRESSKGAARADMVIVSKCPDRINKREREEITGRIHNYTQRPIPVFFTGIKYQTPLSFSGEGTLLSGQKVVAFSGIARPEPFYEFVGENYELVRQITFPDHYNYSSKDLKEIFEKGISTEEKIAFVTTEKDMARLLKKEFSGILPMDRLFYIPIQIQIPEGWEEFKELIKKAVEYN
ncbi:MAG TPA: tetraacyldisaccharide 4'-kinase [Cytophagaceae bacterium]